MPCNRALTGWDNELSPRSECSCGDWASAPTPFDTSGRTVLEDPVSVTVPQDPVSVTVPQDPVSVTVPQDPVSETVLQDPAPDTVLQDSASKAVLEDSDSKFGTSGSTRPDSSRTAILRSG